MVGGSETLRHEGKWHCRLSVAASLILRDGTVVPVSALVDTGSEVNLIRKGLLDLSQTKACGPEVRFCAVNKQSLGKEHRQVSCEIAIRGAARDTAVSKDVICPIKAYDAPIDVDMILSYEWLARQNAQVYPRRHGVAFDLEGHSVWVPGIPVGVPDRARDAKVYRVGRGRRSPLSEAPDPDDYGMRDEVFADCTRRLGLQPTRDCFATRDTAKCEKFFSPEEDGLAQEWDPREVLWVNPPWALWPQAADKMLASGCTGLCILPAWSTEWVQRLLQASTKRLYLEAGSRLFSRHGRKLPGTRWGTWVLRIDGKARPLPAGSKAFPVSFMPTWGVRQLREKADEPQPEPPPGAGGQEGRPKGQDPEDPGPVLWHRLRGEGLPRRRL